MNKRKKTSLKDVQGITLIALVITIIVLLILAAVSIATLTGENGILTKAKIAKEETEKAAAVEKVKVEVMGSFDKSGNLNLDELKENLQKVDGLQGEVAGNEFPITVTVDGQQITVQKDGTVENQGNNPPTFNPETLTIGTAINTSNYGRKVNGYNVTTDEFTSGVWRLFYQDNNYTYLIADDPIGSYDKNEHHEEYKTKGVSTVGKKLNSMVVDAFSDTSTENVTFPAFLTDTNYWSNYAVGDGAVFAIGSPTVELLAASYNSTVGKSNPITFELEWNAYNLGGYKCTQPGGKINTEDNHGIYNKSGTSDCWLASPSPQMNGGGQPNAILLRDGILTGDYGSHPIRPVVCIHTSVFNSKYQLANE